MEETNSLSLSLSLFFSALLLFPRPHAPPLSSLFIPKSCWPKALFLPSPPWKKLLVGLSIPPSNLQQRWLSCCIWRKASRASSRRAETEAKREGRGGEPSPSFKVKGEAERELSPQQRLFVGPVGPPSQGWTGESPLARQPGRAGGPGDPGGGGRSRGLRTAHSFPSNGDWRRSAPFEGKRYWERFLLPSPPPSPRATEEEDPPPPSTLFYGLGLKIFACLELVGLLSVDDLCVRRGGGGGRRRDFHLYSSSSSDCCYLP